jgi:hypothetical protein
MGTKQTFVRKDGIPTTAAKNVRKSFAEGISAIPAILWENQIDSSFDNPVIGTKGMVRLHYLMTAILLNSW